MKNIHVIFLLLTGLSINLSCLAQHSLPEESVEQQMEFLTEKAENEPEDDEYLQHLQYLKKHPLNLNAADENDLQGLLLLSAIQIEHLLQYRKLLGHFINIYELQSVPSMTATTFYNILPFITIEEIKPLIRQIGSRLKDGENSLLIRYGRTLEKSKGFIPVSDSSSRYLGSADKLFFRYRYSYKNLLQWGVTGDKDAGEQLFKGKQKQGFDFYSFHLLLRNMGNIKAIAIGDFTVNMGQGLVHWQSSAMGKGQDALNVKRQSPVLKPYHSAGEFNFLRGIGITLSKAHWEWTGFTSSRNLDATIGMEDGVQVVSSVVSAGYHRTIIEAGKKSALRLITTGSSIRYRSGYWSTSLNWVHYNYSIDLHKGDEAYNLFSLRGSRFTYTSMDYSYTTRNIHLFAELARDNAGKMALLQGVLVSLSNQIDFSCIVRKMDKAYQALYGNALVENTYPGNETGIYMGLNIRVSSKLSLTTYMDSYKFPWLRYRVDAPSYGKEYLLMLTYKPGKKASLYLRYRYQSKDLNQSDEVTPIRYIQTRPVSGWRFHYSIQLTPAFTIRSRWETSWYAKNTFVEEKGFLWLADLFYKPLLSNWSFNIRWAYFDTDGFNSRIYAYENDVLYGYSVPAMYTKGSRYFLNLQKKQLVVLRGKMQLDLYMRFAGTLYSQASEIGSGLDEISGNKRTDLKVQLIIKNK